MMLKSKASIQSQLPKVSTLLGLVLLDPRFGRVFIPKIEISARHQ